MLSSETAIRTLVANSGARNLFISSLGRTAEHLWRLKPDHTLFLDALGDVLPVAIGVAIACGERFRVTAVDTDGGHLSRLTALAVVGSQTELLKSFQVVVLDNGILESAGGMRSGSDAVQWDSLGDAFGLNCVTIATAKELSAALARDGTGPRYIHARIQNRSSSLVTKTIDGIESRYRFARTVEALTGRKFMSPARKN